MTRFPGIGGIETVTTLIIEKLIEKNHITILSHFQQDTSSIPEQVELYNMINRSNLNSKENFEYADKIASSRKFDAIIYQDSYAPTEKIVCYIARKHNIPLYVFEHNSPLFIYNKRNLDSILTIKGFLRRVLHPYLKNREIKRKRFLFDHCKKYVLISNQFVQEFSNLTGISINEERLTYINNPISSTISSESVKENIILSVSRLEKEKGVEKMIDVWSQICGQLPDWKFQIIGDGSERQKLENIVKTKKIPRIEFKGFAQPNPYYQKAKIFLMTSKYEGWGMTIVEAMQQGCVPVAYNTFSALEDIIDNNKNGYIVKYNDISGFETAIMTLSKNNNILNQMSNSAKEKVLLFDINIIIKDWYALFN